MYKMVLASKIKNKILQDCMRPLAGSYMKPFSIYLLSDTVCGSKVHQTLTVPTLETLILH